MTLQLESIGKSFGGVTALTSVNLRLEPSSIHALLGENGAGKSTMIKIMSGVHQPDSGVVSIDGEAVRFNSSSEALRAGVSVVHQERQVIERFSVAENLFLHAPPKRFGLIDYRTMYADTQVWLDRFGLDIDPRQEVGDLSPGLSQLLSIAKALSLECRYLLLDEPTASIGGSEIDRLFEILRDLRDGGTSILFVSHKLNEVMELCDRVTVIRDGVGAFEGVPQETNAEALVEAMVGREVIYSPLPPRPSSKDKEPSLELRQVSTGYGHRDVNLSVAPGEILGLYGLVGAGRTELARAIVGLAKVTGGEVLVRGKAAKIRNPHEALVNYGLAYVSENRKSEGLIQQLPIQRNVGITIWNRLSGLLGWISDGRTRGAITSAVERLNIKMSSFTQPVSSLSGGNQQKVSVSKWLAVGADILIFDEPTVGIDVGAKDEMHRLIWELAESGKAVLVISSDLVEITHLADRVLVMASFDLCAEVSNEGSYDEVSQKIMSAITSASSVSERSKD